MTITPRRLAFAAAFVFLLLTLRPLLSANPDSTCDSPILVEAFKSDKKVEGGIGGAGRFARNRCNDDARAELGAVATRLAFFGVLGGGVALILGWRPRHVFHSNRTPPEPPTSCS